MLGNFGVAKTHLFRLEVEPHPVVVADSMTICPTPPSSSLEVLSAHQARIHVDIAETLGAQALEIEVQI